MRGAHFMSDFEKRQEKNSLMSFAARTWLYAKMTNQVVHIKLSQNQNVLRVDCPELRAHIALKTFRIDQSNLEFELYPNEELSFNLLIYKDLSLLAQLKVSKNGKAVFTEN